MKNNIEYPNKAEFAFTILDDTDDTTVSNGRPVYELLRDLGFRITKTVWAFDSPPEERGIYFAGETLSSSQYLEWVRELATDGFEIAFHNAKMSSSLRDETIQALDLIEEQFGEKVRLHCNHGQNADNLYWGVDRYKNYALQTLVKILTKYHSFPESKGHISGSEYYWEDIAAERLSYIRAFAFRRLNGKKIPPGRPFIDPAKNSELLFFNTADAPDVQAFNKLVNPNSLDQLRKQKGWAIVSTHLGKGFFSNNRIEPEFKKTMEYLSSLPGWYVPTSELLDFLVVNMKSRKLSPLERCWMEYSHILDRVSGKLNK